MLKRSLALAAIVLVLQGCGVSMPRYEANFDNVQLLKTEPALAKLDSPAVTAAAGQDSISARASPIRSPEGSISKHVQKALESELSHAGLLTPGVTRQLDVRVTTANLSAGIVSGRGTLSAEFSLHEDQQLLYSSSKTVHHSWNSSFVGAVAILTAANAFNPLVRKLLAELYQDPAFIKAMQP